MKIEDIFLERDHNASEYDAKDRYQHPSISKVLYKQGYTRLGKPGADQSAYKAPDGTVLKIFKTNRSNRDKLSDSQKMCIEWINYCKNNSSNPFLPKFSGFESFEFPEDSGNMYLQIRMEQLGKFPMKWHEELAEMAGAVSGGTTLAGYLSGRLPTRKYDSQESTATLTMHLGMDGLKALWKTMQQLHKICEARNWHWDLHSGNFMIRSDGQPVILDPYFLGFY